MDKGYQPASAGDNVGIIVTSEGTSKEISIDAIYLPGHARQLHCREQRPGTGSRQREIDSGDLDRRYYRSDRSLIGESAAILVEQFSCFTGLARTIAEKEEGEAWQKSIPSDVYNMPLEKLNLSTHTYNSLRRGGITMTGQLLEKGLDGLMSLGGFGVKSREEVEVVLKDLGVELSGAPR